MSQDDFAQPVIEEGARGVCWESVTSRRGEEVVVSWCEEARGSERRTVAVSKWCRSLVGPVSCVAHGSLCGVWTPFAVPLLQCATYRRHTTGGKVIW